MKKNIISLTSNIFGNSHSIGYLSPLCLKCSLFRTKTSTVILLFAVAAVLLLISWSPSLRHKDTVEESMCKVYAISDVTELHVDKKRKPRQHVVFAKVHKAASSTVHNILTRYAIEHELNPLICTSPHRTHINQNDVWIRGLVPLPPGVEHYDILKDHLIFNYTEISPYFPKDTVYVGILREPFSHLLSSFIYFTQNFPRAYFFPVFRANPKSPFEEMMLNVDDYHEDRPPHEAYTDNRQSIDLGFPRENITYYKMAKKDPTIINEFIKTLDSRFDLMMIAEFFDESLVLLKRMLNWTTRDIIYLSSNVQKKKDIWGHTKFYANNKRVKVAFEKWYPLDIALYKHFRAVFEKKIKAQSNDFREEVRTFKDLRKSVAEACKGFKKRQKKLPEGKFWCRHFPATDHSTEFIIATRDCNIMDMGENTIVRYQRDVYLEKVRTAKIPTPTRPTTTRKPSKPKEPRH